MLRSLRIMSFRGLRELTMTGLARVNLLVGTNNCGKTSVLEATHMLAAPGSAVPLWQAQVTRGVLIDTRNREIDLAHLVHGHQIVEGSGFRFAAETDDGPVEFAASFLPRDTPVKGLDDDLEGAGSPDELGSLAPMWLKLEWVSGTPRGGFQVPLTRRGGARERDLVTVRVDAGAPRPALLVGGGGLHSSSVITMFERVVLTPEETTVLDALRAIEPGIERIASVGSNPRWSGRSGQDLPGGLAMMVSGKRVPIGTMGDGIWRLLGIALALVSARGGVLLVDEIDTGLHYTVLVDMWRLVLATARSLDVQVFATTHSRDCYEALAAVTEANRNEISLQRIERGKAHAIAFNEAELQQAAERGLEVR
jgi:hypothetical protein